MLRWHHRNWLFGNVDAKPDQLFVDVGEMLPDEIGIFVADIEMDIIEPVTLDFSIIGARDNIARGKLGALVIIGHVAVSGLGVFQDAALAAHGLGNQEILDLQIVQAGRMELHELHVRYPAPGAPCHRDTVTSRAARCGRIEICPPCPAGCQNCGARRKRLDLAGFPVKRVDAVDSARG